MLNLEEKSGLYKLETYRKFADRVKKAKKNFMSFILKMKEDGKTVVANSCPGRCVTLLNYYGVNADLIPYICRATNIVEAWNVFTWKTYTSGK